MKKPLLRLFLLPVMVCAMLGVGFMNSPGMAHAATLQTHTVQHYADPGHQCPAGDVEFDDINVHPYCYSANGQSGF
jgi:hypothetical protein